MTAPPDATAQTGSHLVGAGSGPDDPSKRHITNPPPKLTLTATELAVTIRADLAHDALRRALDAQYHFYTDPDRCAKQYIAQWIDAFQLNSKGPFDIATSRVDFQDQMAEGEELTHNANLAAQTLGNILISADYVAAAKSLGPPGLQMFSEHVQGLNETVAGRQLILRELTGGATIQIPDSGIIKDQDYFDPTEYDTKLSLWSFFNDPAAISAWLTASAPRDQAEVVKKLDKSPRPLSTWISAAGSAVNNSYFGVLAEFGAVLVTNNKLEDRLLLVDQLMVLLAPRVPGFAELRASAIDKQSLNALRAKFEEHLLIYDEDVQVEDVLMDAPAEEKKLLVTIKQFNTDAGVWEKVGARLDTIGKALVVLNAGVAVKQFVDDPSLKNGVGLGSALSSLAISFQQKLPLWFRQGRLAKADEDAVIAAAKTASEDALEAAAKKGGFTFFAERVATPAGEKLLPALGVLQGVFDTVGAFHNLKEATLDKNEGEAVAAVVTATGGALITVGSLMSLASAMGAELSALPGGAVLVVVGTLVELAGVILGLIFPPLTALQKWVIHSCFGTAPQGNVQSQIIALGQLLYTPQITIDRTPDPQRAGQMTRTVKIEFVIPGIDASSQIPMLVVKLEQNATQRQLVYYTIKQGKTYADNPPLELTFSDDHRLEKMVIEYDVPDLSPLIIVGSMLVAPGGSINPISVKFQLAPYRFQETITIEEMVRSE